MHFSFQFNFIFLEATVEIAMIKTKVPNSCDKAKLIRIGDKQESFISSCLYGQTVTL